MNIRIGNQICIHLFSIQPEGKHLIEEAESLLESDGSEKGGDDDKRVRASPAPSLGRVIVNGLNHVVPPTKKG